VTDRLNVRIEGTGGPPYAQLRDGIRRRIERGALLPGDRLPTVRACARDLGLAPNTVARAYRELEEDGWLVGRGRAGTFVADAIPARPSDADAALATAADTYRRRAAQLGFSRADAIRALGSR
jgi:DNA-binding transcriptional regulator YhcF (GntR family)